MTQEIEEVPPEPSLCDNCKNKDKNLLSKKSNKLNKLNFKIALKYFFYSLFLKETNKVKRQNKLEKFLLMEYAKYYIEKRDKEKRQQTKYIKTK